MKNAQIVGLAGEQKTPSAGFFGKDRDLLYVERYSNKLRGVLILLARGIIRLLKILCAHEIRK